MTPEAARKVERPPVEVGGRYEFYATVEEEHLDPGERLRRFTGKEVEVLEVAFDESDPQWIPEESERFYKVRADDGTEFEAYEGELDGWFKDTGQFFVPEGDSHAEQDPRFNRNTEGGSHGA
jgi:hypothetical protein